MLARLRIAFSLALLLSLAAQAHAVRAPRQVEQPTRFDVRVRGVEHPAADITGAQHMSRRELRRSLREARRAVRRGGPKDRPPKPTSGDGMAIASLVLGVVGILTFTYLVPSILAIVFGAIARKRYKEGYHDRGKMARAGLILGIVGVGLALLWVSLFLVLVGL